jgi:hypothetical protein
MISWYCLKGMPPPNLRCGQDKVSDEYGKVSSEKVKVL